MTNLFHVDLIHKVYDYRSRFYLDKTAVGHLLGDSGNLVNPFLRPSTPQEAERCHNHNYSEIRLHWVKHLSIMCGPRPLGYNLDESVLK